MINLKTQKPAKRYAEALFQIIQDKNYNELLSELNEIKKLYIENFEFKNFLLHPSISKQKKKEVINEVLGSFSSVIKDFIFLLVEENRVNCIFDIYNILEEKIDEKDNIAKVTVTLAIKADDYIKNEIENRLKQKLNSKVKADFIEDKDIIGGIILKIKDSVIDLSLRKKLENFRQM